MRHYSFDAIVIGSGAAGYAAASHIAEAGKKNVCIVTEGINCGTSRNTGSDKQTYYKLGLSGSTPDSVRKMAETLFEGGCVDGDIALCEAAMSSRCFYYLCEAGVPFPCNTYGEYVGYKTDHDPMCRATSAGPLTSKYMTEALQRKTESLGVQIFDKYFAVEIITVKNEVCGLICLDLDSSEYVAFSAPNVIIATGGPAGVYADSVYPECHHGSTSLALKAGAKLCNITEWQYGLASRSPRWNVSGTYMQVLPRFVSIDTDGKEHEFLSEFFDDKYEALSTVFMKGYQWPFDVKKIRGGSSVIDLLVYRESILRGRKVYLDYTKNPFGLDALEFDKLSKEAFDYLSKANACFGTPVERLKLMNMPAVELYRSKGIDIEKEMLAISLCAQHCNGGIAVDSSWETSVKGLFAVGEAAGTHGITRPGGSALNAGQVGAFRAAEAVSQSPRRMMGERLFKYAERVANRLVLIDNDVPSPINLEARIITARRKMSECAGAIRNLTEMSRYLTDIGSAMQLISNIKALRDAEEIKQYYILLDTLTVQSALLTAMIEYIGVVGSSRGSALYTDEKGEVPKELEEIFRFSLPDNDVHKSEVAEIALKGSALICSRRSVRPIPPEENCFETVWREFRERSADNV